MVGGLLATFVLAFVLNAVARTRAPTTAAIGSTVLGAAWIGLGLGFFLLLREMHDHGRLLAFTVAAHGVGGATRSRTSAGGSFGRHKLAPTPVARQDVGRLPDRRRSPASSSPSSRSTTRGTRT